jgi:hypothetical protein
LIKDHVAFYQDRVTVEIGVATPAVVGHSDAGDRDLIDASQILCDDYPTV